MAANTDPNEKTENAPAEAIDLLRSGWRWPARPRAHHLRRAYALADLYERQESYASLPNEFSAVTHYIRERSRRAADSVHT